MGDVISEVMYDFELYFFVLNGMIGIIGKVWTYFEDVRIIVDYFDGRVVVLWENNFVRNKCLGMFLVW